MTKPMKIYSVFFIFTAMLLASGEGQSMPNARTHLPFYRREACNLWLVDLPKVILHHHLDGSVRPETILEIAKEEKIDLGVPLNEETVRDGATVRTPQKDLFEVLKRFWFFDRVFTSYENVKRITIENLEDLYRDGVRLAELRFAPAFMGNHTNISPQDVIRGVADGLIEGKKRFPDMEVGLIHIVVRSHAGADVAKMHRMNEESTQTAIDFRKSAHPMAHRMVGFDLAGSEIDTPTSDYVPLVQLALDAGMRITVHSGEDSNADRIRQSIEILHAERIGHGVQVWGDEDVMQFVRKKNVHLEIAPTSNWVTNHIPGLNLFDTGHVPNHFDIRRHPFKRIWDAGISVSIEGDDPQLFAISVVHEYQLLHYLMGLTKDDFMTINRQAAEHSFLPDETKKAVIEKYFSDF